MKEFKMTHMKYKIKRWKCLRCGITFKSKDIGKEKCPCDCVVSPCPWEPVIPWYRRIFR